jgi:hypothetical protein
MSVAPDEMFPKAPSHSQGEVNSFVHSHGQVGWRWLSPNQGKHITTTIIVFDEAGNQLPVRSGSGPYYGVYFRVGNDWYLDGVYRSWLQAQAAQRKLRAPIRPGGRE